MPPQNYTEPQFDAPLVNILRKICITDFLAELDGTFRSIEKDQGLSAKLHEADVRGLVLGGSAALYHGPYVAPIQRLARDLDFGVMGGSKYDLSKVGGADRLEIRSEQGRRCRSRSV